MTKLILVKVKYKTFDTATYGLTFDDSHLNQLIHSKYIYSPNTVSHVFNNLGC